MKWTDPEVDALVDYLHQHYAQHGGRSFKDATFTNAAKHIKHLRVSGKVKDGKSLWNKWNYVGYICYVCYI